MKGLIDSTLREGTQTVGVYFSPGQKRGILKRLIRLGVEEIEIGRADEAENGLMELLAWGRSLGAPRLAVWSRCSPADVAAAARLKPDVLSLSMPVSDRLLAQKLGQDRDWALARVESSVAKARAAGIPFISLGLEDATRAGDFLCVMIAAAARLGIDRVRLADTVGVATPASLAELVGRARACGIREVGVHTHNDFGMATANAVAALEAGADWADVTVLGLGERAGCARLEEVAGFFAVMGGNRHDLRPLPELAAFVATAAGREIPGSQPVVGRDIFACETGLHLIGLFRDPATYEPFAPELVGNERRLLLGGKAGKGAVNEYLHLQGLACSGEYLECVTSSIRASATTLRRPLLDAEVTAAAWQERLRTAISNQTS